MNIHILTIPNTDRCIAFDVSPYQPGASYTIPADEDSSGALKQHKIPKPLDSAELNLLSGIFEIDGITVLEFLGYNLHLAKPIERFVKCA